MISLQQYLSESIFDDIETVSKKADKSIIKNEKDEIKRFIEENYLTGRLKISPKRNDKGLYEVSTLGEVNTKPHIKSLTNGEFEWTYVKKNFNIYNADIKDLKGAPREVGGVFKIMDAHELESMDDCPEVVGISVFVATCNKLKTLGSFKSIGARKPSRLDRENALFVSNCDELVSLGECPKYIRRLSLINLAKLKSLKGCPEEVEYIYIKNLTSLNNLDDFPKADAKKLSLQNCPIKNLTGICYASDFVVWETHITDLTGCPRNEMSWVSLEYNEKLKSLKGRPDSVVSLNLRGCNNLPISALEDLPEYIDYGLQLPQNMHKEDLPERYKKSSWYYRCY